MAGSEALLVSSVVLSGELTPVLKAGIDESMCMACPNEVEWLLGQYDRLGHVPDREAFRAQFPEFVLIDTKDVASHAHAVVQGNAKRRLVRLTDSLLTMLQHGEIDRAITEMGSELLSVQATMTEVHDNHDVIGDWPELFDMVEDKVDKVKNFGLAGVPTGWRTLDRITGGLQDGWLVIVGGRLGHGKTYVMVRMAAEAAKDGSTALYFSLEQSRHQIGMRAQSIFSNLVGTTTQLKSLDMMRGTVENTDDVKRALKQIEEGIPGKLLVNDTSRGAVGTMQVASAIEQHRPDIVFIDYLTLLKMQGDGEWRSVAQLSADLKRIGERYEIPIVAGAQLNRSAMSNESPDAGTIAQADAIGQDADMVLTLSKPSTSVRRIHLAKNRHGPDGIRWPIRFKPGVGDLTEITGDEAGRLLAEDQEVD